ncbi:hypothetical protein HHI36_003915 [Cryptolaemus montrouzieri]|uniref:Uncharacterized protein n=1 Tax=Cryptolaemus montrouzieri TaxID=559131 RepID=A0ABD2NPP9_9CUCU
MFSDNYAELYHQMIQQNNVSAAELKNMSSENSGILYKFLSQLIGIPFQERKTTISTRSSVSQRRKLGILHCTNFAKVLRKNCENLVPDDENCVVVSSIARKRKKSKCSHQVNHKQNNTKDEKYQVPVVYLQDILSTQGSTSKSDFMGYFGLYMTNSEKPNQLESMSNSNTVKLAQASNLPISSDLGIHIAARENHVLPEAFKLRKIERYEWYINKPFEKREETVEYPITYVDRTIKNIQSNVEYSGKIAQLAKLCKPLFVNVKQENLLKRRKQLLKNARQRKLRRRKAQLKKCRNLKIIVTVDEKKKVDMRLGKGLK